jgi:DNA-binding IclR family transcriptional regulator
MRQVREVLRLRTAGVGLNEIARRVGVAPSTVRLTLKRLASAGLSWPLPAEMTDGALETALFAAAGTKQGAHSYGIGCANSRKRQKALASWAWRGVRHSV